MQYVFVPLILVVATGLTWTWWSSRGHRDPASSVHSFNRALHAMQPGGVGASRADGEAEAAATDGAS